MEDGLRAFNTVNDYVIEISNVLILVVMEDGLRDREHKLYEDIIKFVLILVVMEDGLRGGHCKDIQAGEPDVLILVVMEDGLREMVKKLLADLHDGVLILVVMEDGLRGRILFHIKTL